MSTEPENRLIDEPEFRELIQTAKTIDVEDAWLDAQLDQLLEKIGSPSPPDGGSTGSGGGTGNLVLNAVKFVAPLIVGLGIYVTLTSTSGDNKTTLNRITTLRQKLKLLKTTHRHSTLPQAIPAKSRRLKSAKRAKRPAKQDTLYAS